MDTEECSQKRWRKSVSPFLAKSCPEPSNSCPRWQRGVFTVDQYLGDAVGQVYAQKYFPPEAKKKAQEMVAQLIEAFRKRIEALTWMNPSTKAEAEAKLWNALCRHRISRDLARLLKL